MKLFNKYQTELTQELIDSLPKEIIDDLYNYIDNIPFIQNLVSPNRQYARDRPRDSKGRIIVDLINPHILEDMDYFRETAIHFQKYGCFTKLKKNKSSQSEYMRWFKREIDRCWNGMVRPEDGEWITGDMYFYLNYFPIIQTIILKDEFGNDMAIGDRKIDFPKMWEGVYLRSHYLYQARYGGLYNDFKGGNHAIEIAARGKSKSYFIGSKLTKNFLLGNNSKHRTKVKSLVSAYQKEYLTKDGILNKFVDGINFLSKNTQFPGKKIKKSWADLQWVAGWLNKDNDPQGTENEVLGVAVADDVDKMRGKRSDFMGYEEFGMYPRFLEVWQTSLPNVQEGAIAFGQAYAIGTGGSEGSDFFGAYEMIMYPLGYNVYGLPNVYDRGSTGNKRTIFFFPDFINRVGFYNKDGVSDVIGAMIDELKVRYNLKYNSSDPLQLTKRRAEYAFTLQDAIMRRNSTIYPVADLNDRIGEIDNDPDIQNKMWVGRLDIVNGKVEYRPDSDIKTILNFPHKDNNLEGAITIHKMPIYDSNGKIPWGRYIAGADPYDDDHSETLSLFSGIILDLWTDEIVLEYTGRPKFADDAYENWRRCLMFYNAECNYENNKKGLYTYFSKTHSLHLLSDNLDFLKDKENLKINYGNKSKGTGNYSNGKGSIAGYARMLNRNYLLKPVEIITEIDGEEIINSIPQLKLIPYRALLQELAMWNEDINTDRHDALSMLMLLREDKLRLLGDNSFENKAQENDTEYLGNDEFFKKNYKSSRNNGFNLHPLLKEMIDKEKK